MKTFDQFIKDYLGKKIDYDGWYGGQCMDLYHQYVVECLNLEHPPASGAYLLWTFEYNDYIKIPNDPYAVPQKGDIMIWNSNAGGGYGHVAVFIEGDVNGFTSFDQNWPTLSKCTKTYHNYNNVSGWLRPKYSSEDPMSNCKVIFDKYKVKDIGELDTKLMKHVGLTWGDKNDKNNKSYLAEDRRSKDRLEQELRVEKRKVQDAEYWAKEAQKKLNEKNTEITNLHNQIDDLKNEIKELHKTNDKLMEANLTFAKENESLKNDLNNCANDLTNCENNIQNSLKDITVGQLLLALWKKIMSQSVGDLV